jgi:hypothetical protein
MGKNTSIGKAILRWVQILTLVLGGLWSVWITVFKEYKNDNNVYIEIKFAKTGQRDEFISVAADIRAINKSQRNLFLRASPFILRGIKNSYDDEGNSSFIQRANSAFERYESANSKIKNESIEVIAAGQLYVDAFIQSNETLHTTRVLYIKEDVFDHVFKQT